MKTIIAFLPVLLFSLIIQAQTTYVPDNNFEQALIDLGADTVLDDYVLTLNISEITELDISYKDIRDLTGIEDFMALTTLVCNNNLLGELDVTQNIALVNLNCLHTNLNSLDLSFNPALTTLDCSSNQIISLDLSHNSLLTSIKCTANELTTMSIKNGNNYAISHFNATYNKDLYCIEVDDVAYTTSWLTDPQVVWSEIGNCFSYTHTYVPDDNFEQALIDRGLDNILDDYVLTPEISRREILDISGENISDLTGIEGFSQLHYLNCDNNQLSSLDLNHNTGLHELYCSNNLLTNLRIDNIHSLSVLSCNNNQLTNIIGTNYQLNQLYCSNNQLASLDVSQFINLTHLNISNNQLTSLDVSDYRVLMDLDCSNNQLTSLDVSQHTILGILHCENNQLTSLDVSNITGLRYINCNDNQLTSLDISNIIGLRNIKCNDNQLIDLNVKNGNNVNFIAFDALRNPNLNCIEVDNVSYSTTNWTNIDIQTSFGEHCHFTYIPDNNFEQALIDLGIDSDGIINQKIISEDALGVTFLEIPGFNINTRVIADLTGIEAFTDLQRLNCSTNALTDLDLSSNPALTTLYAFGNQLSNLNVSNNTLLTTIRCADNLLTSIDVGKNTGLLYLTCQRNQLSELYLQYNVALEFLLCSNNQLTELDLSYQSNLTTLGCMDNQLTSLDVRNGNNSSISVFNVSNNPSLTCIQVDNASDVNAGIWPYSNWQKDIDAIYAEDCENPYVFIPDANFEQALIDIGIDTDGIINQRALSSDLSNVVGLNVSDKSIRDLTGIEGFINLKYLYCRDNMLPAIDLEYNIFLELLTCSNNLLTSLDVSKNIALTTLNCYNNQLKDINVSQNTALINLFCDGNQLTSLDLSQNIALIKLYCGNNQISTIIASPSLTHLYCEDNDFTVLDLSPFSSLIYARCERNPLTSINISQNTNLQSLNCSNTPLLDLNVRQNLALSGLNCSNTQLSSLDLSQNIALGILECQDNALLTRLNLQNGNNEVLRTLNAISNPSLTCIQVDNSSDVNAGIWPFSNWQKDIDAIYAEDCENPYVFIPDANFEQALIDIGIDTDGTLNQRAFSSDLTVVVGLDVSEKSISDLVGIEGCKNLKYLYCRDNQLTTIDLGCNTSLELLVCDNNQLTSLDVSQNSSLTALSCSNNLLTDINISQNVALIKLFCEDNQLSNLDLSQNLALIKLYCGNNQITTITASPSLTHLYCLENDFTVLDLSQFFSLNYVNCGNNQITTIIASASLTHLYCQENDFTVLDLSQFSSLNYVNCESNPLTNINISQNSNLQSLSCSNTLLSDLNVTKNLVLRGLDCSNTQLTKLNLTKNTALGNLNCINTQITELDLSQNIVLGLLECQDNALLARLNLQNGNNEVLRTLNAISNPSLTCIQVDNSSDVNAGIWPYSNWQKDIDAIYAEDCENPYVFIPDANFEQALIDIGIDTDGTINQRALSSDLATVIGLNVSDKGIRDLTGIEGFINLKYLYCGDNLLTAIDLEHDVFLELLTCSNNLLANLDVSKNIALTTLNCYNNQLADINVSQNTALINLFCDGNQLISLDLSHNTSLIKLYCGNNILLMELNLKNGNNDLITTFIATSNPMLSCIQVDNEINANAGLQPYSSWQKDAAANYSQNCPDYIYIPDPNFEQALIDLGIDSDGRINKQILRSDAEGVEYLNVSDPTANPNLPNVNGKIADLTGVEGFTALKYLYCDKNELTSLDLSKNNALVLLYCRYNQLAGLNVSGATNLQTLECFYNHLTSLDVSTNIGLTSIACAHNSLVSLDVSNNLALVLLNSSYNNFTHLNVANNLALVYLACDNNQLTSLDVSNNAALTNLVCESNLLTNIDLSNNTALIELRCHTNQFVNLDLTNNTALTHLECYRNSLSSLDLSNNSALTHLHCYANQIPDLDLRHNTKLIQLFCTDNQLTYLDLTNNSELTFLICTTNPLVQLNIKNGNNDKITEFKAFDTDLSCINVDNELDDHSVWMVDPGVIFSNDCGYNTQRGVEVPVTPVDEESQSAPVVVTFESVGLSGQTTIEITEGVEDPGGILFPEGHTVYNIETSAEYTGEVEICIDYYNVELASETGLRLLHYESGEWLDVTTSLDVDNNIICGAVATLSPFTILEDITPPELFGVPADVTLECSADVPPNPEVTVSDNVDDDITIEYSEGLEEGECANDFILTKTWSAADDWGNSVSESQIVTVFDNTPPVITVPLNVTLECDMITDPSSTGFATASDNCTENVSVTHEDVFVGDCGNTGVITRTWSAVDECGNTANMVQTITIVDTFDPILTPPANVTLECPADVNPDATGMATATDNCGEATLTYTDESVPGCGNTEVINRNWIATDECENMVSAVQIITVVDELAPIIMGIPSEIVQENDNGLCGAHVYFTEISAIDNCNENVKLSIEPASGDFFPVGVTTVNVIATDDCGNESYASFDVIVTNEDPLLQNISAPVDPLVINSLVSVFAIYSDNNLEEAIFDWGDGTVTNGNINGDELGGEHSYSQTGVYILTLTITDVCGETVSKIYQYIVVYDPTEGFVTGGGWIYSPPGAYSPDPFLEGIANFGFVSKYKKGATVPVGNTEFQFKTGNLNFKSTVYEWLVIAGAKAMFKGSGTINGFGNYGFMLSAIDANLTPSVVIDKFRIKIWDKDNNEIVVYDNNIDVEENADPTTEIGGGSIVIHKSKKKSARIESNISTLVKEANLLVYPNPFNERLQFEFVSPENVYATIDIYDVTGRKVKTVFNGPVEGNVNYRAEFVPVSEVSNFYFYQMKLGEEVFNGKVVYNKR